VYGQVGGRGIVDRPPGGLAGETASRFGPQRNSNDLVVSVPAFSGFSVGRLDADASQPEFAAPTLGLTRLLDIQASDLQLPNDDHLMGWQGSTGNALSGFPQVTPDMAFFVSPAIADLDGDGINEIIAGNGLYTLGAHNRVGAAGGLAQAHRRLARRHTRPR
jgi:hypothetical protein